MITKCVERFLEYVKWETTSDPNSGLHPSNEKMFEFAKKLALDMKELNLENVIVTDKCYVYGVLIKASKGTARPEEYRALFLYDSGFACKNIGYRT